MDAATILFLNELQDVVQYHLRHMEMNVFMYSFTESRPESKWPARYWLSLVDHNSMM